MFVRGENWWSREKKRCLATRFQEYNYFEEDVEICQKNKITRYTWNAG